MAACFDYKAAEAFADVFSNYVFYVLRLQSHVAVPSYGAKISKRRDRRGQGPSCFKHSCVIEIFFFFLGFHPQKDVNPAIFSSLLLLTVVPVFWIPVQTLCNYSLGAGTAVQHATNMRSRRTLKHIFKGMPRVDTLSPADVRQAQ